MGEVGEVGMTDVRTFVFLFSLLFYISFLLFILCPNICFWIFRMNVHKYT